MATMRYYSASLVLSSVAGINDKGVEIISIHCLLKLVKFASVPTEVMIKATLIVQEPAFFATHDKISWLSMILVELTEAGYTDLDDRIKLPLASTDGLKIIPLKS